MLRLADVKAGDILYDLGCGDGRIVIAAAKRFGIKAVGIDIDPVRITESNKNAAEGVTGKVRFVQQDLFETDFRDATVVTMYLLTSVNRRLRPKLLAELKPGTRLVSHSFDMGDWRPDQTSSSRRPTTTARRLFLGRPGQRHGAMGVGPRRRPAGSPLHAPTSQQFQVVTASGTTGGWPLEIDDIELAGDVIKFRADAEADGKMVSFLYEGKVQGHTIVGTVKPADNPKAPAVKWKAARDPKTARSSRSRRATDRGFRLNPGRRPARKGP